MSIERLFFVGFDGTVMGLKINEYGVDNVTVLTDLYNPLF